MGRASDIHASRLRTFLGCITILATFMVAGGLSPSTARAELAGCRSDPVVLLSNQVSLDLSAAISDSESDVQQVAYAIHAPSGTQITGIVYTSGALGPKEIVYFYAGGPQNTYSIGTVVRTMTPGISVVASAEAVTWNGASGGSTTGISQQYLHVGVQT